MSDERNVSPIAGTDFGCVGTSGSVHDPNQ